MCPAELAADSRRGRMQGQRDEKTSGRSRGDSPLAREREGRRTERVRRRKESNDQSTGERTSYIHRERGKRRRLKKKPERKRDRMCMCVCERGEERERKGEMR